MGKIAAYSLATVLALSLNLNAIDSVLLARALAQTALVGLAVLVLGAAVPFTGLVTERGEVRAIGFRAIAVALLFMAACMAIYNVMAWVGRF